MAPYLIVVVVGTAGGGCASHVAPPPRNRTINTPAMTMAAATVKTCPTGSMCHMSNFFPTWVSGSPLSVPTCPSADHDAAKIANWKDRGAGGVAATYPVTVPWTHGLDVMGGGPPTHEIDRSREARPQLLPFRRFILKSADSGPRMLK